MLRLACKICKKEVIGDNEYILKDNLIWHYKEKHKKELTEKERQKYFLLPIEKLDKVMKEKKYKCFLCKKEYKGVNTLSFHYRVKHNKELNDEERKKYDILTKEEVRRIRRKARGSLGGTKAYHRQYKKEKKEIYNKRNGIKNKEKIISKIEY